MTKKKIEAVAGGPVATDKLTEAVTGAALSPSNAVVMLREYGTGAEWPLDRTRHAFTLGAAASHVDVVVPRKFVSRQHATLQRVSFWLDVVNHSPNGTYFGGAREDRAPVKAGDAFTVGTTTLLALDDFMVGATAELRRQLGRAALVEVDAALVSAVRREQPPIALTGPSGTEPDRLARVLHAVSPRRALPFEVIDVLTTRHAVEAAMERVGGGSVFVDLRPLREKKVSAAMYRALFGPAARARVYVAAPTRERVRAALDDTAVQFDVIDTPPIASRAREIIGLLDALMIEQASPLRASHLVTERQEALSRYEWPGNQEELRTAAIRIAAHLASGGSLSAAARTLGVHHSTLRETLQRIGVLGSG